ncbi:MAG: hypothetical protein DRJ11_06770 [Candidatus Aminicenantes bacterium]|nr:MAG: hypothetical protein DRJ11_06770 [Candidatus Aminicenantes bacterium]
MLANWDHQLGLQPIGAGPSPFTNLSTQIKEDSDLHLVPLRKGMGGNIVGILIGSWIAAGTIHLGAKRGRSSHFTNEAESGLHLAPLKKGIGGHIKKKNKKRKIIFLIDKFQLK